MNEQRRKSDYATKAAPKKDTSMLVSGIEWDTDGVDAADLGLPTELNVDVDTESITDHDDLADWISGKYGWAVSGYSCDPPFGTNEKLVAFAP